MISCVTHINPDVVYLMSSCSAKVAFLSSRFKEPSSGYAFEDEEVDLEPCPEELLLVTEKDTPEIKNPFKPSTWRLDVGSKEGARDSECYLHRILH